MGSGGSSRSTTNISVATEIATNIITSTATYHNVSISASQGLTTVGNNNIYSNVTMNQTVHVQIKLATSTQKVTELQNDITSALSAISKATSSQGIAGTGGSADTNTDIKIRNSVMTNITTTFMTKIQESVNAKQFITTVGNNNVYDSVFLNQTTTFLSDTIAQAISQTSLANTISNSVKTDSSTTAKSSMDSFGEAMAGIISSLGSLVGMALLIPILIIGAIIFGVIMIIRAVFSGGSSPPPQPAAAPAAAVVPAVVPVAVPAAVPTAVPAAVPVAEQATETGESVATTGGGAHTTHRRKSSRHKHTPPRSRKRAISRVPSAGKP